MDVEIRGRGDLTVGRQYTLTCNVTGDTDLQPTRTYRWTKTNSTHDNVHVGNDRHQIHFDNLRLRDAGEYTCTVTISSPFLMKMVSRMSSHTVAVSS